MEEWEDDRSADLHENPEALLYYAVLETYAVDLRLLFVHVPEPRRSQKCAQLLAEARDEWTGLLCEWLDISHPWFCQQLEKKARELGYETRL